MYDHFWVLCRIRPGFKNQTRTRPGPDPDFVGAGAPFQNRTNGGQTKQNQTSAPRQPRKMLPKPTADCKTAAAISRRLENSGAAFQESFKNPCTHSRNKPKRPDFHPTSSKTRPTRQTSLSKLRRERNGNGKICLFCRICSLEKDIELQDTDLTHERANKTLHERLMPLQNRTCSRDVIGGIGTSFQVSVKSRVVLSTFHRLQKQTPS